nr:hypothetical transcript [Hymenolepis microstoma]
MVASHQMKPINNAVDSLVQGTNDTYGMTQQAVGGAANRVRSSAVNTTANAIGKTRRMNDGFAYNTDRHEPPYDEFDGNGISADYKYKAPAYSDFPEKPIRDAVMNCECHPTKGSFESQNRKGSQFGHSEGRFRYSDRRKGDFQKGGSNDNDALSLDSEKLNQLIELINQMPSRRNKIRPDEAQMECKLKEDEYNQKDGYRDDCTQTKGSKGRLRDKIFTSRKDLFKSSSNTSSSSSLSTTTTDSQSKFSFRLGGKTSDKEGKKFKWSKVNKKNENAECQEFADKKVSCAEIDMVPCMVPKMKCNCCSEFNGNCDCDDRFNRRFNGGFEEEMRGDCEEEMNEGFNGGFDQSRRSSRFYDEEVINDQDVNTRRRRRFSGDYDEKINDGFNGGMNSYRRNGMNDGVNKGMSDGFKGGFNNGMTGEGFNMKRSNGMKMASGGNMTGQMRENRRMGTGASAETNGLSSSLNALNEALGGIVNKLPLLKQRIGMNAGSGVMLANGFNNGFGGNLIGNTRLSRGFVGGQNLAMGANFGGMGFGMRNNFEPTGSYDDKFSGYGGSLEEIRNAQGGYTSAEVRYPSLPNWPLGNNRSNSLPPGGYRGGVGSNLNISGMNDYDYEIRYIEPDMKEYNRKVKEAKERAERKRQELIRQRDEEVARKRAEMEKQIEAEYERRKAEAKNQREAEIKARMSQAQEDIKRKEQYIMRAFTQKLKSIRDLETARRIKYERALAEANQRSQPLKQQFALTQLQIQELEAFKAQLQQQEVERRRVLDMLTKQLQAVSYIPAYKSDTGKEKVLLADFCQRMSAIKNREKKVLEDIGKRWALFEIKYSIASRRETTCSNAAEEDDQSSTTSSTIDANSITTAIDANTTPYGTVNELLPSLLRGNVGSAYRNTISAAAPMLSTTITKLLQSGYFNIAHDTSGTRLTLFCLCTVPMCIPTGCCMPYSSCCMAGSQFGHSEGRFRYSDRRKGDFQKGGSNDNDALSLDSEKLNQLIELINQMPSRRNKIRPDEAQMECKLKEDEYNQKDGYRDDCTQTKGSKGRLRDKIFTSRKDLFKSSSNTSSSSSLSTTTTDSQSKFSFRLGGKTSDKEGKKFKWSKVNKKNENAECQEFADKKVSCAEIDMVPCMVPKMKCNCCSVPKCVMVPCGEFNGNCDCDDRFNRRFNGGFEEEMRGDCEEEMNEGFNGGFDQSRRSSRFYDEEVINDQDVNTRRRRRFSGDYDEKINDGFNGGMNSYRRNGMNDGVNKGMSDGFKGGFNNGMTGEGFNMKRSNGMKMASGGNMTGQMRENRRMGTGASAETNGLSSSLNALNEALGGIVNKLPLLKQRIGMNAGSGVMLANGFNNGFGGNLIGNTRLSRGFVGGQNLAMGANFGGMGFGMRNNFEPTGSYDDKFSGYGGSLEEIRNAQGGYTSAEVRYPSLPNWPLGNNRSNSLPPGGYRGGVGSNLNISGMNDYDYEIRYIEPDMKEYNRKVKEAKERAERKRQELIRQRDEEVARKRAEMEKQIEAEYERRKAEAKNQREAEIKARMSQAQEDIKRKEQYIMRAFTQKLKSIRDLETARRIKYERALAEANQRSQPLKQQFALTQLQIQELEAFKAQLQQQEVERRRVLDMLTKQLQAVSYIPAYKSDTGKEKVLLADFCQRMSAIKNREKKVLEDIASIPLPRVVKPPLRVPSMQIPSPPPLMPTPPPMAPSMSFCPPSYGGMLVPPTFQCAFQLDAVCPTHLVAWQVVAVYLDVVMSLEEIFVHWRAANHVVHLDAASNPITATSPNVASRLGAVGHRNAANHPVVAPLRDANQLAAQGTNARMIRTAMTRLTANQ